MSGLPGFFTSPADSLPTFRWMNAPCLSAGLLSRPKVARAICCWLLAAFAAPLPAQLPPHVHAVESHLERDFGHMMGSLLRQTIVLETDAGFSLEEGMLPAQGGAVNDVLEVRSSGWEKQVRGDRQTYRITVDYQIFKGVREPEALAIPTVALRLSRDGQVLETESQPLPFVLHPLISAAIADEDVTIRGLKPLPTIAAPRHGVKLAALLAVAALLLAFALRHLGLPPFASRTPRPFDRASREMRKLRRQPATGETWRRALRLFHEGLNGYARRTVLEGQLPRLFDDHPELSGLRPELETVFALSHRTFFASEQSDWPRDFALPRLEDLCRRCRAIERRRRH